MAGHAANWAVCELRVAGFVKVLKRFLVVGGNDPRIQYHPSISHAKELVLPLLTAWYALSAAQQGVGREQAKE